MRITAITKFKCAALLEALRAVGWSQSELARRTGMTQQRIGMYCNLRVRPSEEAARKIQFAFGNAGYFLDLETAWPETFAGLRDSVSIEQTRDVDEQALIEWQSSVKEVTFNITAGEVAELLEGLSPVEKWLLEARFRDGHSCTRIARRARKVFGIKKCSAAWWQQSNKIVRKLRSKLEQENQIADKSELIPPKGWSEELAHGPKHYLTMNAA